MADTAFDRIRAALESAGSVIRSRGTDVLDAQCPAHADNSPSLTVTGIEGQTLVHCHVGCHYEDVLAALGMTKADLYDTKRGADYRYNDGRVVHRKLDKKFRQSGNTKGTGCLYRLDKVQQAVAAGTPVFVVEGEKDVHAIETLGEVATCSPMGAGSARKCDWTPLKGADVIVIADKDEPGYKHAWQVHKILTELDCRVGVFEAKEGKDTADHVAGGHMVKDFVGVELPGDETAPVLRRLSDVQPERVEWLWPGRFPAGKLVVLDGDPSLGKSTLALTFAAHISTGKPWPDCAACPQGDVIVMSAEDGLADTIRPRLDAAEGDPGRVHAFTEIPYPDDDGVIKHRPPTLADTLSIRRVIKQTGARLLIVDVLMAYMPSKVDSHRDQDVRGVLHHLSKIAEQTGCCVLLLRHLNKAGGSAAMYRGGGSIGIVGAARAGYLVAPDPEDESQRVLACVKSNLAAEPPSLSYRLESAPGSHVARVVWTGESQHAAASLLSVGSDEERGELQRAKDFLTESLGQGGRLSRDVESDAREGHNISVRTYKRARQDLGVIAYQVERKWYVRLPGKQSEGQGANADRWHPGPLDGNPSVLECIECGEPAPYRNPNTWLCSRCESEAA